LVIFYITQLLGAFNDNVFKNALMIMITYSLSPSVYFFICLLIRSIYRVKKDVDENIQDEGPAILVCNHVGFVDALIPIVLSDLWGALFSRKDKALLSSCPRKFCAKTFLDVSTAIEKDTLSL